MRLRILLILFCLFTVQAHAKVNINDYTPPSLAELTEFSANFNIFKLNDQAAFKEYLNIADCPLAASLKDSPFKLREEQSKVIAAFKEKNTDLKMLYYRLPVTLKVSGYNFDTQSLPVIVESQFKKVNSLELTPARTMLCNQEDTYNFTKIPGYYVMKLNFPISLYRVPMQRDVAESFFNKLDFAREDGLIRLIYGYMYVQVETIQPQVQTDDLVPKIMMRGQVNMINLYLDRKRTLLFKTLDYSENF